VLAKFSGSNFNSRIPHLLNKSFIESHSQLLRRRINKARPPTLPTIAEQRELANHQHPAADIGQRQIHLSGVIFKHAQTNDFLRQPANLGVAILMPDSQEHDEPAANPPCFGALHRDMSLTHSLHTRTHLENLNVKLL
jgi:hypothetical protein